MREEGEMTAKSKEDMKTKVRRKRCTRQKENERMGSAAVEAILDDDDGCAG